MNWAGFITAIVLMVAPFFMAHHTDKIMIDPIIKKIIHQLPAVQINARLDAFQTAKEAYTSPKEERATRIAELDEMIAEYREAMKQAR